MEPEGHGLLLTFLGVLYMGFKAIGLWLEHHNKEDVKTTVVNKGNETQIKVGAVHDCVDQSATALDKKFEEAMKLTIAERISTQAFMEELRSKYNVLEFNLKKMVLKSGEEWTKEITIVREKKGDE